MEGCKRCDSNLDCIECYDNEAILPSCVPKKKGNFYDTIVGGGSNSVE